MRIRIELGCGDSIKECVEHAKTLAKQLNVGVVMEVSGEDLNVDAFSDVDEIIQRHKEYRQRIAADANDDDDDCRSDIRGD